MLLFFGSFCLSCLQLDGFIAESWLSNASTYIIAIAVLDLVIILSQWNIL